MHEIVVVKSIEGEEVLSYMLRLRHDDKTPGNHVASFSMMS